MKSTIAKVFLIIGVLVIALIAWNLFFDEGGILQNAWNGVASQINGTWIRITGSSDGIIPSWGVTDNIQDAATQDASSTGMDSVALGN